MTLRHMKIFVTVYQNKGITSASQILHLAQPSVSLAIRELEEYYGIHLFERIGRRIYPTECGKDFYGYALHIVSLFDEMETKVRNWDAIGTLRIGASVTIGTHLLPGILKRASILYPDLTIKVLINNSTYIEEHLMDNTIDVGLIETRPELPDLVYEPFMKDNLCANVPPGHPLCQKRSITLSHLAQYPMLMREKGSAGRELLDACFALEQVTVHPIWESSSTQAIVKGVAAGIGVAVLPYLLLEKDIQEHTVDQVTITPPLKRDFNIIYHKSKYLTTNMHGFINACKKYGSESN